ncbi:MAG: sigma factor-like helix-turn-helix DNA-binding protein [Patescibacteria group bacterium]
MGIEQTPNLEESYARKELIEMALKSLKPKEERVLRLRFFNGMTLEEVATELGLSSGERARQVQELALRKIRLGHELPEGVSKLLEQLER